MIGASTDKSADCIEYQQDEFPSSNATDRGFRASLARSTASRILRADGADRDDCNVDDEQTTGDNQDVVGEEGRDEGPEVPTEIAEVDDCVDDGRSDEGKVDDRTVENRISCPYKTRQELHVTYNVEHARYEGLPVAWRALNVQFGLPLEAVPKRAVDGYEAKIPAVLQMMKDYLLARGGENVEGIFRLAPDRDECAAAKRAINNGTFSGCSDVNVVANLIKVREWLEYTTLGSLAHVRSDTGGVAFETAGVVPRAAEGDLQHDTREALLRRLRADGG